MSEMVVRSSPPRRTIRVDLEPRSEFARGIIKGVGQLCRERQNVRFSHSNADWEVIGDAARIDGVIAAIATPDPNHRATRFGCPIVNISSACHPVPFTTVTIDNIAVGRLAADHLLTQGYLHFACHIESRAYFSRKRAEGFLQRLQEADRPCAVFDTAPDAKHGDNASTLRNATAEWLHSLPKPLGLFTHTDNCAAALIEICQDAHLSVPEQIGIIGTDDEQLLLMTLSPTLSSIDPAPDVIGFRAAELLLDLIDGASPPPEPILIPPRRAVQRQSTVPVFLDDEMLAMAVSFIRKHATDPITVDDVIEAVPFSRRSLERRFRRRLGRSPADEIRRVQIDRAKWLLLESSQKRSAIARSVGYNSFRNFATAFRREVGMTPTKYFQTFRTH